MYEKKMPRKTYISAFFPATLAKSPANSLSFVTIAFPGFLLGLGTSALVGDPDPYPRVFGRQISHPDP